MASPEASGRLKLIDPKRKVLVTDGIIPPERIVAYLKTLEKDNPSAGKMREVIEEMDIQLPNLLKLGGVISSDGTRLHVLNGQGYLELGIRHLRIPPRTDEKLEFRMVSRKNGTTPAFFLQKDKLVPYEEFAHAATNTVNNLYRAKQVGHPRISSRSVIDQILMQIVHAQGRLQIT